MKITNIETLIVDAGWRPWMFVKVETDEGITGWGECSDGKSPHGIEGVIRDLKPVLIGKDPCTFEMRFQEMYIGTRATKYRYVIRHITVVNAMDKINLISGKRGQSNKKNVVNATIGK